jgi:hypothetical protein
MTSLLEVRAPDEMFIIEGIYCIALDPNVRKELKFDSIVNTRYNPGPEMAQFTDECSSLASMIPAVFNALI